MPGKRSEKRLGIHDIVHLDPRVVLNVCGIGINLYTVFSGAFGGVVLLVAAVVNSDKSQWGLTAIIVPQTRNFICGFGHLCIDDIILVFSLVMFELRSTVHGAYLRCEIIVKFTVDLVVEYGVFVAEVYHDRVKMRVFQF